MLYESWDKRSVHGLNPDECQLSCSIIPCSELYNSVLRPAANGQELENSLRYVMGIKENKLEKDRSRYRVYMFNMCTWIGMP
jgi:hypothetical protein